MFPPYSPPDALFGTIVWMDAGSVVLALAVTLVVCAAGIALNREPARGRTRAPRPVRRSGLRPRPPMVLPARP